MSGRRDRVLTVPQPLKLATLALVLLPACAGGPPPLVTPSPARSRPSSELQLQQEINRLLLSPALARGTVGIFVYSLERGDTLFAVNEHKLLTPASTEKIVTLAVAADRLGWNRSYETTVTATGSIENGVLTGDLIVVGSGDPTIDDWDGYASARFAAFAATLKERGIRAIAGRIVGDDNAFEDEGIGAGWAWDDLHASYAAPVGALQFNQNTAQLVVSAGQVGEPAHVDIVPDVAPLILRNLAATSAGPEVTLSVRPEPRSGTIEIVGTVPLAASRTTRNVAVQNPTLYFVNALRAALVRNGIEVRGPAIDIDDVPPVLHRAPVVLADQLFSRSLEEIATTMMKVSQNLYAETLFKTAGALETGNASSNGGRRTVRSLLTGWGVPASDFLIVDGSGLSRYNLITAEALVKVLAHVYRDERLRDPFLNSLPIGGIDGTLSRRLGGSASGRVQAKTGSLANARSVAGYLRTADDELFAFAILANNYNADTSGVDDVTDGIIMALTAFTRGRR